MPTSSSPLTLGMSASSELRHIQQHCNTDEMCKTSQIRLLRLGCSMNRIRYRVYLFRFSTPSFTLLTRTIEIDTSKWLPHQMLRKTSDFLKR